MVGTQSYTGGLGMDFDVLSPVVVTKLGVFDSGGNGLSSTLTVQLFRRSPPVSVLAALTFTPAAPGTLEPGTSSRMKALTSALTLAPGQYCIVSYGHNANNPNDNVSTRGSKLWTADDGNGLLAFVGGSRYGGSPGSLPSTVDGGPSDRYAAGTFEYTTRGRRWRRSPVRLGNRERPRPDQPRGCRPRQRWRFSLESLRVPRRFESKRPSQSPWSRSPADDTHIPNSTLSGLSQSHGNPRVECRFDLLDHPPNDHTCRHCPDYRSDRPVARSPRTILPRDRCTLTWDRHRGYQSDFAA